MFAFFSNVIAAQRRLLRDVAADRWRLAVVAALLALGGLMALGPPLRVADLALLDLRFATLARVAPLPASDDVVIVALDEATLAGLPEPVALLHRPLARLLHALAVAQPRVVALDLILPERSYDAFAPGSDAALAAGLIALRRVAPVVIGATSRADGGARPIHRPFLAAAGSGGDDWALFPLDADGRVRRYDDRMGANGEAVSTIVGRIAALQGIAPVNGIIQYALGDGFDYTPLGEVLAWAAAGDGDRLLERFRGKIVLIGSVLPHEDRGLQPVRLARWEAGRDTPGVVVHAQMLRTQLAQASVAAAPWYAQAVVLAVAAALWLIGGWHRRLLALIGTCALLFVASVALLRWGVDLDPGPALRLALAVVLVRTALDAWLLRRDRERLRTLFGGYVSPGVLAAILENRLDDEALRGRRELCFLFADIRDFVRLSAFTAPEQVLALLNRYYSAVTPAIHDQEGTIDNFRGDGLMAVFGAPNVLASPERSAIAAARSMFARLADLNDELVEEGRAPLAIRVTLAAGPAVVGNVGARDRFTYSAIGAAANVAARLQEVARARECALVATEAVLVRAGERDNPAWKSLGSVAIRGGTPVAVFAADPPMPVGTSAGAQEQWRAAT